jgi:hypothetical protein
MVENGLRFFQQVISFGLKMPENLASRANSMHPDKRLDARSHPSNSLDFLWMIFP